MNGMEMFSTSGPIGLASGLVGLLLAALLALLSLLVPVFIWRIWAWSARSCRELQQLNAKFERLLAQLETGPIAQPGSTEAFTGSAVPQRPVERESLATAGEPSDEDAELFSALVTPTQEDEILEPEPLEDEFGPGFDLDSDTDLFQLPPDANPQAEVTPAVDLAEEPDYLAGFAESAVLQGTDSSLLTEAETDFLTPPDQEEDFGAPFAETFEPETPWRAADTAETEEGFDFEAFQTPEEPPASTAGTPEPPAITAASLGIEDFPEPGEPFATTAPVAPEPSTYQPSAEPDVSSAFDAFQTPEEPIEAAASAESPAYQPPVAPAPPDFDAFRAPAQPPAAAAATPEPFAGPAAPDFDAFRTPTEPVPLQAEERPELQEVIPLPQDPQRPTTNLARCGSCGHKLAYRDSLSGKRVKCPSCQKPLTLP